jgi:ribonuclease Z
MVGQMDITFLGTSSAVPSSTRNHQSMALRLPTGKVLVFDVGEATQHQFQKSPIKTGRIQAIFITHLHGDHCYGLPALMCTTSMVAEESETLEIYGPANLRQWLRITFKLTYATFQRKYRVHEFLLPGDPVDDNQNLMASERPGDNIELQSSSQPHWLVQLEDGYTVKAVPILHSIPALGYIVCEPPVPGKINLTEVKPLLDSQRDALAKQGIKNPMTLLGQLQKGQEVVLPDGTKLLPAPPRRGRKVVILGDTKDATSIVPFCESESPHVLVHEATNALTSLDTPGTSLEEITASTIDHGHSTPQMAGRLAKAINAKHLLLTHFSSRYRGDKSPEALAVMEEIRSQAAETAGHDSVYCARDLWSFNIEL